MATTLDGITLPNCQMLKSNKDAGLFNMAMPGRDSNNTFIVDLFGASRTITLSGKHTGTEADATTFTDNIDGLIDGAQSSISLVTPLKTYTVYVLNVSWDYAEGSPGTIEYTIQVMQGA